MPPREDRDLEARLFAGSGADALRTAIAKACLAAAIPLWSPHDLRQRRVSLLHLRGVPWARIGERVGQRNLAVTATQPTRRSSTTPRSSGITVRVRIVPPLFRPSRLKRRRLAGRFEPGTVHFAQRRARGASSSNSLAQSSADSRSWSQPARSTASRLIDGSTGCAAWYALAPARSAA
jgi:hypothetical protein